MAGDCGGKIRDYVAPLDAASFRNREKASGSQFAVAAAVSETDLSRLNQRTQLSFGPVVGIGDPVFLDTD